MTLACSNEVAQLILSGLREIIGQKDLERFLNEGGLAGERKGLELGQPSAAEPIFSDLGSIQAILAETLSAGELHGLLLRCGKAASKFFVRQYGPEMQITTMEYRLLPSRKRVMRGLNAAAGLWGELFGRDVSVVDEGDQWIWREEWPRPEKSPLKPGSDSYFTMGLLQEYLSWLSGGKTFYVRMNGDNPPGGSVFSLRIQKRPID